MSVVPRARVCEVFEALRAVHPAKTDTDLAHLTAHALGLDSDTVAQVVRSDLTETEGGSAD